MSLEALRARLHEAAIVLDFDGSLAPIVEDPADARALSGTVEVLSALVPRAGRVAVVTGRPSRFVSDRLPVPGLEIVGVYGLEGFPPIDEGTRATVEAAVAGEPGAHLEDKGPALVVHLRRAGDPAGAARRLRPGLTAAAASAGLDLLEGKQVLELAPPGGGKGRVLRGLAEGMRAVLVAGDDLADVDAFEVAAALAASGLIVCRVAVSSVEMPIELVELADLTVEGPRGLLDLLRTL